MKEEVFEKVVKELSGKLYGYLYRLLGSREDAEDILQSTYESFYENMSLIDSDKYRPYLYRTAHNKAINHIKKNKRYIRYTDGVSELSFDNSNRKENPAEERVRKSIQRLKTKESMVIELKYYQHKRYKEIAEILETTPEAVDSLLVRAKRKLRKYLQDLQ